MKLYTLTLLQLDSKRDLLMEIDQLKLNLIKTALLYGINHPFTISTSQDLDKLIIEYQKLAIK